MRLDAGNEIKNILVDFSIQFLKSWDNDLSETYLRWVEKDSALKSLNIAENMKWKYDTN
jgi:hypothetical protein